MLAQIALLFSVALSAQAETSQWSIAQRPTGNNCYDSVVLDEKSDSVTLIDSEYGTEILKLSGLNEGRDCIRRQTGTIFGTLYCYENEITETQFGKIYSGYICTSDSLFAFSCNPKKNIARNEIIVSSDGKMELVRNYTEVDRSSCQYTKN